MVGRLRLLGMRCEFVHCVRVLCEMSHNIGLSETSLNKQSSIRFRSEPVKLHRSLWPYPDTGKQSPAYYVVKSRNQGFRRGIDVYDATTINSAGRENWASLSALGLLRYDYYVRDGSYRGLLAVVIYSNLPPVQIACRLLW